MFCAKGFHIPCDTKCCAVLNLNWRERISLHADKEVSSLQTGSPYGLFRGFAFETNLGIIHTESLLAGEEVSPIPDLGDGRSHFFQEVPRNNVRFC